MRETEDEVLVAGWCEVQSDFCRQISRQAPRIEIFAFLGQKDQRGRKGAPLGGLGAPHDVVNSSQAAQAAPGSEVEALLGQKGETLLQGSEGSGRAGGGGTSLLLSLRRERVSL